VPGHSEAIDFLKLLYGANPMGYLVLWTRQNKFTRTFHADRLEDAAAYSLLTARNHDVYFGIGLQKESPRNGKRGGSDGVILIPGFWMDIDIRGENHVKEMLPNSLDDVMDFLKTLPYQPTISIFTGGGVQAYWLFENQWIFDNAEERSKARDQSKQFQASINIRAARLGWSLDDTSDLARLLRLPGTYNHKHAEPQKVYTLKTS
jgi:hypothetical protein